MYKWILLAGMLLLSGCSLHGAPPPYPLIWKYIMSPTGQCYEYVNWFNSTTGYTIAGQVDPSYCK